ncbi:MAG: TolC family protein [Gemmatimonadota bacterium]
MTQLDHHPPARRTAALAILTLAALAAPLAARAQQPADTAAGAPLSLDDALRIARQNNPTYLASRNDESAAAWGVRSAYASWLPTASVGSDAGWSATGPVNLGSVTLTQAPAYYWSSYSANVGYSVNAANIFNIGRARANRRAAAAGEIAAASDLEAAVTRQYLAAMRARDQVDLARQQLQSAQENLDLAKGRVEVGAAAPLEGKQASVEVGRARVALVRAQGDLSTQKLRLLQQLGVELDRDIRLTTSFQVFDPQWTRASVMAMAEKQQPRVRALEAQADAQNAAARAANSRYLPTISIGARWSGITRQIADDNVLISSVQSAIASDRSQCEFENELNSRLPSPLPGTGGDCSQFQLTDSLRNVVLEQNNVFPFQFKRNPFQLTLSISLPIFQGLQRQQQVATARAAADDARYQARAESLRARADANAALLALKTAYAAAQLEEENRQVAAEQLEQARERYRVGIASFVDLAQAETLKSEADQSYLSAVYDFQSALTDLEAAVGQRLRSESGQ